jgi:hypothetical protein
MQDTAHQLTQPQSRHYPTLSAPTPAAHGHCESVLAEDTITSQEPHPGGRWPAESCKIVRVSGQSQMETLFGPTSCLCGGLVIFRWWCRPGTKAGAPPSSYDLHAVVAGVHSISPSGECSLYRGTVRTSKLACDVHRWRIPEVDLYVDGNRDVEVDACTASTLRAAVRISRRAAREVFCKTMTNRCSPSLLPQLVEGEHRCNR